MKTISFWIVAFASIVALSNGPVLGQNPQSSGQEVNNTGTLDLVSTGKNTAISSDTAADELVRKALEAYDNGRYDEAVTCYESLIASGVRNGHLYYNLGHAYFRSGRMGESMAAFLAARRYLPRDPDVKANLNHVLAQVPDKVKVQVPESSFGATLFWVDYLTPREWAFAATSVSVLSGLFLLSCLLLPPFKKAVRWAQISLLVPMVVLALLFIRLGRDQDWGAVKTATAKVYSSPSTLGKVLFQLRAGAPFLLVSEQADGFYKIEISDGKKGWIARDATMVL